MSEKAEGDGPSVKTEAGVMNRHARDKGSILVYGHKAEESLEWPKGLSALVVNEAGEVFGAGVNSLVGGDYPKSCPMKAGGGEVLQKYVKVDGFNDWHMKKIVVGPGFGAALSDSNEVLVWGGPLFEDGDFVSYKKYEQGKKCSSCSGTCSYGTLEGVTLSYCSTNGKYQLASVQDSSASKKTFVRHCKGRCPPTCSTCNRLCSSTKKLSDMEVYCCPHCNYKLLEKRSSHHTRNPNIIRKLIRTNGERVRDIACTDSFICILLESNKLVLKNYDTWDEHIQPLVITVPGVTHPIYNKTVVVESLSLYGGSKRCFVRSKEGTLFECPIYWDYGSPFQLTKIDLPAAVEKVCCGPTFAAALLVDGSVWFISGDGKTYHLELNGVSTFTDLEVVVMTNAFLVQMKKTTNDRSHVVRMRLTGSYDVHVQFSELPLVLAVSRMVFPLASADYLEELKAVTNMAHINPAIEDIAPPTPNPAHLFGKTFLSDMTIQLSDGMFPAHSCVLVSTSAHFKATFTASTPPPKVLDVSEYNPKAYRCLLQYFYQLKPDDLDAEDLVDLRQIATSYGETALAEAATSKIKTRLDEENVVRTFARAKHFDFQDLIMECGEIMLSSTVQDRLLQAALKDTNLN